MKELSTDLDREQKEKILPEHTRHLTLMLLSGIGIALVIALAIILIWFNAELIDSIKPVYQMAIVVFLAGSFGIIRLIVWLRNLG